MLGLLRTCPRRWKRVEGFLLRSGGPALHRNRVTYSVRIHPTRGGHPPHFYTTAAAEPAAAELAMAGPANPTGPTQPFSFAVLQAPLMLEEGPRHLPRHLQPFAARLQSLGGAAAALQLGGTAAAAACATAQAAAREGLPLVLLMGSGGTEALALEAVGAYHDAYRQHHSADAREAEGGNASSMPLPPVLLLAHPYANSLPSSLETLAKLHQEGLGGRILYLPSAAQGAAAEWDALQESLHGVRAWLSLHAARIGLVGPPSPWLVASAPPPAVVRAAWGPCLVDVPLEELVGPLQADRFDANEVQQATADVLSGGRTHSHPASRETSAAPAHNNTYAAASCRQCAGALDAGPAAKAYLSLREVVRRHGLQCLTVRCFDMVTDVGTTGCYALARLLDEGAVVGCEGDVCTTLGMLWGQLMTGQVPWMANVAQVDPRANSLLLAHCTAARSLLSTSETNTHFESGLGVAIQGSMAPGPVTLLRIGGKRLEKLWVEEGEIPEARGGGGSGASADWSPGLCRTQVHVRLHEGGSAVAELLRRPLGNHLVLLRGHHGALLEGYWRDFGPGAAEGM